jgi:hypothetical protein
MSKVTGRIGIMFVVTALMIGLGTLSSLAGNVTINLGTTNYQVTYNNDVAKVTVQDISYPKIGGNFDVITEKVTLLKNVDFILSFSEKKAATDTSGTGVGPKYSIDEVITNGTDKTWFGFSETLKDFNFAGKETITLPDGKTRGNSTHPVFAHFHPGNQADGIKKADLKISQFKNMTPDLRKDGDGIESFFLSNGSVPNDKTAALNITGLFIHAIDVAGEKRSFDLVQTPSIPEPANLILFGTGMVGLLGYAWISRRKRFSGLRRD